MVCLHALGASRRSFELLSAALGPAADVVALDLPGFGDAPWVGGGCAEVVRAVAPLVGAAAAGRDLLLLGHSMGAKYAGLVASGVVADPPTGLRGLVLVTGSPLRPEPMSGEKRRDMVAAADRALAGDGSLAPSEAAAFVDSTTATRLPAEHRRVAIEDVRRADPAAWRAWFASGSREDWADRAGPVDLPTLLVAGAEDGDLGPRAQQEVVRPSYPAAEVVVVPGAAHQVPWERPGALAREVVGFWRRIAGTADEDRPDS